MTTIEYFNTDPELGSVFQNSLATAARIVDRRVTSAFDDRLRAIGLRSTQITTLASVASLDTPTATELGLRLALDATTLSRNLARLETSGFITRTPDSDARRAILALTDLGRDALRRALPMWQAAQNEVETQLGGSYADSLRSMARQLVDPNTEGVDEQRA